MRVVGARGALAPPPPPPSYPTPHKERETHTTGVMR